MSKIREGIKLGYDDVTLVPTPITRVRYRSECNPFVDKWYTLPIFVAPMSQIVDVENYDFFRGNGVFPILPRNVEFKTRVARLKDGWFVAFGLAEVETIIKGFETYIGYGVTIHLCLDLANGHMQTVIDTCVRFKEACAKHYVYCKIMTGNIANPEWVKMMNDNYTQENTPIDFIRCSIGSGSVCITSTNTAVHYPTASLIKECAEANYNNTLKIVADGGIKDYSDVIKAIGLGADYVMAGGIFVKTLEACGHLYSKNHQITEYPDMDGFMSINIDAEEDFKKSLIHKNKPYRHYYGMASKKAQKEFGGNGNKTAEGKSKTVNVEYTLKGWVNNMTAYFRSAMSYTDSFTLDEFREKAEFVRISQGAYNAVNK